MNKNYVETTNVQVNEVFKAETMVIHLILNGEVVSTYTFDRIDLIKEIHTLHIWQKQVLMGRIEFNIFKHNLRHYFTDYDDSVIFYNLELNK